MSGDATVTTATARAPFLDLSSFSAEEAPPPREPMASGAPARSPFLSVYERLDGEAAYDDPVREAYATLMNDLYDEEFDEALFELQCSARAMHDAQLAAGKPRAEADGIVTQYFSPLLRESAAMIDATAREFATREQAGIVEQEVDAFIEGYTPANPLDPEFERLFGNIAGKVGGFLKKAASTAWRGIKAVGLGAVFGRIKGAVQELLKRVISRAIGKLPSSLQPVAQQLASKLGFGPAAAAPAEPPSAEPAAAPDGTDSPVQPAAGDGTPSPQEELNQHFAAALLAQDEVEFELEAAQLASPGSTAAQPVFAELDDARERFIAELESLGPDDSAAPHIQNFAPMVMAALKVATKIAGRPNVVKVIAQPVAALIKKLVGPQHAQPLARAIADAGLKLVGLELSEAEAERLAPSAVAATVEETIARVASLPEEVLDNQELLEGYVLEAFEHAAAANLPAVLPEQIYRQRPDLLEAGVNAGWVLLPLRGPKRYKRCTRSFRVTVSPQLAEEVESFEGSVLADHLQDQLGMDEGEQVEGELHLYEALPGTSLADIARGERETLGPGLSDEANAAQLHPLTPQAAGALMGKPALGRALPAGAAQGPGMAAGQRLYHLATGKRPLMVPGRARRPRRRLRVNVTLDGVRDEVRVCVLLSEVRAQKLAARLRQATNLGLLASNFDRAMGRRLNRIFGGQAPARLRIVHAAMRPGQTSISALQNLPPIAAQTFAAKLRAWLVQAFAEFIKAQSQSVIAAADDSAEGVALSFTVKQPPGLKALGQALTERGSQAGSAIAEAISKGAAPTTQVAVFAGHRCG
jgi:hypothetical protein